MAKVAFSFVIKVIVTNIFTECLNLEFSKTRGDK